LPQPSLEDLAKRRKSAERIARSAGELLRKYFAGSFDVRFKSAVDPVTTADLASEKLIAAMLAEEYPGELLISEEEHARQGTPEAFWLVDPLDGTVNFSHRLPWFSVAIAYVAGGVPQVGVVYAPEAGLLFSAAKEQGATRNGEQISVSGTSNIQRAIVATGFPYDKADSRRNLAEHDRDVRRMGCASLDICMVACGVFDAYYEFGLGYWDFSAGWRIAQEAGATVAKPDGGPPEVFAHEFLCTTPLVFCRTVAIINGRE